MEQRNYGIAGYRGIERRRAARATASASLKPAVPKAMDKPAGRHGAIRNTLPSLAKYRAWSAKARTDWPENE